MTEDTKQKERTLKQDEMYFFDRAAHHNPTGPAQAHALLLARKSVFAILPVKPLHYTINLGDDSDSLQVAAIKSALNGEVGQDQSKRLGGWESCPTVRSTLNHFEPLNR